MKILNLRYNSLNLSLIIQVWMSKGPCHIKMVSSPQDGTGNTVSDHLSSWHVFLPECKSWEHCKIDAQSACLLKSMQKCAIIL